LNQIEKRHVVMAKTLGHINDQPQVGAQHLRLSFFEGAVRPAPATASRPQRGIIGLVQQGCVQSTAKRFIHIRLQPQGFAGDNPLVP